MATAAGSGQHANAHRIKVEEDKPVKERGFYLYPDLFGQSEEKGVEWAKHPNLMQRLKEEREQMKQKPQVGRQ